jgi:hypothetical protein
MIITQTHSLGQGRALEKVKTALTEAQSKYSGMISNVHEDWHHHTGVCSFKCMGFKVEAKAVVGETFVILEGNIPFMLRGMQSKIEKVLGDSMAKVLREG